MGQPMSNSIGHFRLNQRAQDELASKQIADKEHCPDKYCEHFEDKEGTPESWGRVSGRAGGEESGE
jgi:hypothetical protein